MSILRSLVVFLFGAGVMFGAWAGGVLDDLPHLFHHGWHAIETAGPPAGAAHIPPIAHALHREHMIDVARNDVPPPAVAAAPGPDQIGPPIARDDGLPPGPISGSPPPGAFAESGPPDGVPDSPPVVVEKPHTPFAIRVGVQSVDGIVCAPLYSFDNHTGVAITFKAEDGPPGDVVVPAGGTLSPGERLADSTLTEANCGPRVHIVLQQ